MSESNLWILPQRCNQQNERKLHARRKSENVSRPTWKMIDRIRWKFNKNIDLAKSKYEIGNETFRRDFDLTFTSCNRTMSLCVFDRKLNGRVACPKFGFSFVFERWNLWRYLKKNRWKLIKTLIRSYYICLENFQLIRAAVRQFIAYLLSSLRIFS